MGCPVASDARLTELPANAPKLRREGAGDDLVIQREDRAPEERGIHFAGERDLPAGALVENARQGVRLPVADRDRGPDDRAGDPLCFLRELVELSPDRDQMAEAPAAEQ